MEKEYKKYIDDLCNGFKEMFSNIKKGNIKIELANILTLFRLLAPLVIVPLTIFGITLNAPLLFTTSGILTLIGGATDCFDGIVQRKISKNPSNFGKVLDQIADKVFSVVICISLSLINPLFLINILGEASIGLTNLIYKKKEPSLSFDSTMIGKIKMWPLLFSIGIGFFAPAYKSISELLKIIISASFVLELATVGSYIKQNEKEIKKDNLLNIVNKEIEEIESKQGETKITKQEKTIQKNNRLEQYKKLRDLLKAILEEKEQEENKIYKKTKN